MTNSSLTITITEQPIEYHRFRYETEVAGEKLGGLLYGRHGSKSCVRLRLSGIDPSAHSEVIVIGGTVNPDRFPHPFYLKGENCTQGVFQYRKDVSSFGGQREIDISLDKVSLICVSTRGQKLEEAIGNRLRINFNPFNQDIRTAGYNLRNTKSVRLAFQAFYTIKGIDAAIVTDSIALSDIIQDAKLQPKLGIYNIHPSSMPAVQSQELWIYFDEALTHADPSLYTVLIAYPAGSSESSDDAGEAVLAQCSVSFVKKHLICVKKPDMAAHFQGNCDEVIKCVLIVREDKTGVSDRREIRITVPPPAPPVPEILGTVDLPDDFLLYLGQSGNNASTVPKRSRVTAGPTLSIAPNTTAPASTSQLASVVNLAPSAGPNLDILNSHRNGQAIKRDVDL